MKHVVRVLIAVLVVALLGYLVYFFAFKPDPDISTFNSLVKLQETQDTVNVDAKITELNTERYDTLQNEEIKDILEYISKGEKALIMVYSDLDRAFDYYFGYTSFVKDVKSSTQKAVDKAISNYKKSLLSFSNKLNIATSYQTDTYEKDTSNTSVINELKRSYQNVLDEFVNLNKCYYNLNRELLNLIQLNVFDGELITDVKSCELDIIQQACKACLDNFSNSTEYEKYIMNLMFLDSVYVSLDNELHADILKGYIDLSSKTNAEGQTYLNVFLNLTHSDKAAVAVGNEAILSIFPDDLRTTVTEFAVNLGF